MNLLKRLESSVEAFRLTLAKIEVVTEGAVRRAKLYYLRDRVGKAAKIKERRIAR